MAPFLKRILLIEMSSFQQFLRNFFKNEEKLCVLWNVNKNGAILNRRYKFTPWCTHTIHWCYGTILRHYFTLATAWRNKWRHFCSICFCWRWKIWIFFVEIRSKINVSDMVCTLTNFVLFHTLKTVWEWRQTFKLCLKYTKTWINTLYWNGAIFLLTSGEI